MNEILEIEKITTSDSFCCSYFYLQHRNTGRCFRKLAAGQLKQKPRADVPISWGSAVTHFLWRVSTLTATLRGDLRGSGESSWLGWASEFLCWLSCASQALESRCPWMQERWDLQMGTICKVSEGLSNQRVLSSWYILHYLDLIEVWRFQAGCLPCLFNFLIPSLQSIKDLPDSRCPPQWLPVLTGCCHGYDASISSPGHSTCWNRNFA